mmetsp:Transcript_30229/g.48821  ORF Transcript_30229/g.48821 Transcript_30229/m.48821 type:complete len:272 (+) Transcript_30229:1478-2293(+)
MLLAVPSPTEKNWARCCRTCWRASATCFSSQSLRPEASERRSTIRGSPILPVEETCSRVTLLSRTFGLLRSPSRGSSFCNSLPSASVPSFSSITTATAVPLAGSWVVALFGRSLILFPPFSTTAGLLFISSTRFRMASPETSLTSSSANSSLTTSSMALRLHILEMASRTLGVASLPKQTVTSSSSCSTVFSSNPNFLTTPSKVFSWCSLVPRAPGVASPSKPNNSSAALATSSFASRPLTLFLSSFMDDPGSFNDSLKDFKSLCRALRSS